MAKILIVDDSTDLLHVVHWMLQKKGCECVTTYYREGVYYQLQKFTPSLIIIDVNLDGDDGREICQQLKSDPATGHIPIIVCSGNHELLNNYRSFQADDCLEKPFDSTLVVEKIEKNLLRPYSD